MTKLINLLYMFARAIERIASRIEQSRRQDERDELEANPGGWHSDHFGGMRDNDADKADSRRDRD